MKIKNTPLKWISAIVIIIVSAFLSGFIPATPNIRTLINALIIGGVVLIFYRIL